MSWFFGFKNIFIKKISLPQNKSGDLVFRFKLKNDLLKLGTQAEILEGFNLVTTHYNHVCDVIPQGDVELSGATMPELLKFNKKQVTSKGEFIPTSLTADVYFVSTAERSNYPFKTPNYIETTGEQGKVKIRLEGTFSLQVVNTRRFMQAFLDSYAIVKDKDVVRDLSYHIGKLVEQSFGKNDFVLSDYLGRRQKILDIIIENIHQFEIDNGLKITKIFISNVIVPKRYKMSKGFLQDSKQADFNSEDLFKLVENRLNNLQDDMMTVATDKSGSQTVYEKNASAKNTSSPNQNDTFAERPNAFGATTEPFDDTVYSSNFDQQAPKIIIEEDSSSKNVSQNTSATKNEKDAVDSPNSNFAENSFSQSASVSAQPPKKETAKQSTSPAGFENNQNKANSSSVEDKNQSKEDKPNFEEDDKAKQSQDCATQSSAKESKLITCPCCGAKNIEGVQYCCVCKSKL
jgi:hypothetical protein